MAAAGLIALFSLIGIGVLFVAFSGGPGQAREAYLTGGRRVFPIVIVIIYIALGITIPAVVIADKEEGSGGDSRLSSVELSKDQEEGKQLFRDTCASCHNLEAVNARGVTGPDLDTVAPNMEAVLAAIETGASPQAPGQGRMPPQLLVGSDAEKVADYVSAVAGKAEGP